MGVMDKFLNYMKLNDEDEFDDDYLDDEEDEIAPPPRKAEKIKKVDPLFSENDFISWTKDLYVKMQHAWTARKWEEMRPLETEKLFEQHSMQLQEFIIRKRINVVDQIAVNYATILEFRQTEDKDIIDVALKATKKDYIIEKIYFRENRYGQQIKHNRFCNILLDISDFSIFNDEAVRAGFGRQ